MYYQTIGALSRSDSWCSLKMYPPTIDVKRSLNKIASSATPDKSAGPYIQFRNKELGYPARDDCNPIA